MQRRHCLSWIAATAALCAATPTWAQPDWPSKPIRFVLSQPAGSGPDAVARLIGNELGPRLGQPIIVDNKPGGQNAIGAQAAARAPADGYTFYFTTAAALVTNPFLFKSLPYDPRKDFTSVGMVGVVPFAVSVHPGSPFHTLADLVAYAKANPGKVNFGSSGNGSSIHLSGELFKSLAKVDMVHVPYKGSAPAVTDLLGNQIGIMFDNMPSAIQHVRSGKLVPIAVTTAKRSPELPNVPTIAEAGVPGYEATSWFGMFAPAGTPAPVLAKLNTALVKVLNQAEVKKKINEQGAETYSETPEQFAAFIQAESVKWGKVVKESGASLD